MNCPGCNHWNKCPDCNDGLCEKCGCDLAPLNRTPKTCEVARPAGFEPATYGFVVIAPELHDLLIRT
jgi:hypothetical protein